MSGCCARPSAALGGGEAPAVGRDGASDAVFFLDRGIPSIEFGPAGGGHHGPEEYVEVESLARYRRASWPSPDDFGDR